MDYYYNMCHEADTATKLWDDTFELLCPTTSKGLATATSRDGDVVAEMINARLVLTDPTRGIVQSKIRKMPMRYAVGELMWYLSGSQNVEDIAQFSEKWRDLSDDGLTANSAYGHRIFKGMGFDQWAYVYSLLRDNPNSRQAVIHIKDADDRVTKDMPCTLTLQFLIREGALYLTVNMRSNDIWMGLPYDMFSFTCMQLKMAMELGVQLGTYTHNAASLHLYERDYKIYLRNRGEVNATATQDTPKGV